MKNNTKGGMQSSEGHELMCRCGKPTSKKLVFETGKEIAIHFGKKTYWHIYNKGKIKRTFIQPKEWS